MERTTMFLNFSPDEDLPQVGDTIEATSGLTHITYRITILAIKNVKTLSNGTIQLETRVEREAQA